MNPAPAHLVSAVVVAVRRLVVYRLADDDWIELPALLQQLPDNLERRAHPAALYDAGFAFGEQSDENVLMATLRRQQGAILWRYPLLLRAKCVMNC
ncbi:MAG: hypothetical protein U0694_00600 [Anaerolineae bacterium]